MFSADLVNEKGDIDMLSAVYILEDFLNSKEGRDV